jgi:WD40 repeat protein
MFPYDRHSSVLIEPRIFIPSRRIFALTFSPDGARLATGDDLGHMHLFNVHTGDRIGNPLVDEGCIISVTFSPNGTQLATANVNKTVKLWTL